MFRATVSAAKTEYTPATYTAEEHPSDIPQFSKLHVLQKDLKDNEHCLYLVQKYGDECPWTLFVPQSLQISSRHTRKTVFFLEHNVCGQIPEHIFAPNGDFNFINITLSVHVADKWLTVCEKWLLFRS